MHDSADYYNIKLSVFSEDKKTDLIGESFLDLSNVIVPGGGKNDIWQGLTCKGKYAGEIRLELTYYDSRPKAERPRRASNAATEDGASRPKVKRRPLPGSGSVAGSVAPSVAGSVVGPSPTPSVAPSNPVESFPQSFPLPAARPRHGPRELGTPPRANSMPPEVMATQQPEFSGSPAQFHTPPPPPSNYGQESLGYGDEQNDEMHFMQPEFLPQLPPTPEKTTSTPRTVSRCSIWTSQRTKSRHASSCQLSTHCTISRPRIRYRLRNPYRCAGTTS